MNQHPPPPYPQYPAPQQSVSFAYPTPSYHQSAAQQTPYAYPATVPPTSQQQQAPPPPTSQHHHQQPQPPHNPPSQPQLQQPPNPFFQNLSRQQHTPSLPRPSPVQHQAQASEPGPPSQATSTPQQPLPLPQQQQHQQHQQQPQPHQQQHQQHQHQHQHQQPPPRGVGHRQPSQVSRSSQQPAHDGPRSIPSTPGHGPGAPPPDRNSPDPPYDQDLMIALRQDNNDDGDQSDPQGEEDKDEPVYQIPPPPEEIYPNADELEKALHAWSLEHGYELVRRASKKNARGVLYKRYFHCSKHGKTANTSKLNDKNRVRVNRKSNRIGCPMSLAAVAVNPHDPSGNWQIRHRKSHHNHPPVDAVKLAGHRRRARMGGVEKAVDGLFVINTSTADVLKFLQRTHPDGLFTRTDVANMKLKWKKYGTCTHHGEETATTEKPTGPPPKIGVASACLSCRSKKTKCDSIRPSCGQCARTGANCQYDHDPQVIALPPPPQQPLPDTNAHMSNGDDTAMVIDDVPPAGTNNNNSSSNHAFTSIQSTPAPDRRSIVQTEQILAQLASFQQEHVRPTKLYLESSTVETLAHSSCGNGDSYKNLPTLTSIANWPTFRDAFTEACLKENTHDVLVGLKKEPLKPNGDDDDVPVEEWNEYIKQLAIFNRRNSALLGALWGSLAPNLRSRVSSLRNAHDVWLTLEDLCSPRGSDQAFGRFSDLHNLTLRDCGGVLEHYAHRLETAFHDFNQLVVGQESRRPHAALMQSYSEVHKRNRGGNGTLPEEMLCFLFLNNLGPEYRPFVENLCKKNNIAGFGSGERLGFKELTTLVRRMLEWDGSTRNAGTR